MESPKKGNRPTALITGFSSGIGFEYSKYLAANNWYLELVAQNPEKAKKSFDLLSYTHSRYHLCDLSRPEGLKDMISKINQPNLIIANGSGTDVAAINKLLKQFKMMSEMMKKMSKGNTKGMMDKGIPPELFNQLK